MKFREIAKSILLARGGKVRVGAEDTALCSSDLNEGREAFTPKQVEKVQEKLDDLCETLRKKWKLED